MSLNLRDYEPQKPASNRLLVSIPQDIPGLNSKHEPAGVGLVRGTSSSMVNKPDSGGHPWRVSNAGDDLVTVSPGKVIGIRDGSAPAGKPWYCIYASYAGGDITITGAGWLYAVASMDEVEIEQDTLAIYAGFAIMAHSQEPYAARVEFSSDSPSTVSGGLMSEVWIPIAEVDLDAGEAVIVDQVLTHNPTLFIEVGKIEAIP